MVVAGAGDRAGDRMKVLIDMNLSPRWQSALMDVGIGAVHWSEVGDHGGADSVLAAYALSNGLNVLTQDLDFGALLAASGDSGPSVVQIRTGDTSPESIGQQVVSALEQLSVELDAGALVTIDVERSRLRMLPIRR